MKHLIQKRAAVHPTIVAISSIACVASLLATLLVSLHGCGKKKEASKETSSAPETPTEGKTIAVGGLTLAIPAELSVVSPYSTETVSSAQTSAALADAYSVKSGAITVGAKLTDDPQFDLQGTPLPPPKPIGEVTEADKTKILEGAPQGFAQARAQRQYMLRAATGIDACMYKVSAIKTIGNPNCYGPSRKYQYHADATTPGPYTDNPQSMLPSGDLGIWEADEAGEACIAVKMNGVISDVSGEVDDTIGLASMLSCISRLDGAKLPDAGKDLDLMPAAGKAKTQAPNMPFTFLAARISRAAEDHNGHAVYTTELKYEVSPPNTTNNNNNLAPQVRIQTIKLKHSPLDDNNDTYLGQLNLITDIKGTVPSNDCNQGSPGSNPATRRALSILYSKSSEERIQYEMRQARFKTNVTDDKLFDTSGNMKYPVNEPGACNLGGDYANFDLNPKYGTGKVAYSWFAGFSNESGRSMVVNVGVDPTDNDKSGCGYYGFGEEFKSMIADIDGLAAGQSTSKLLNQFFCSWAGPNNSKSPINARVQGQCIKQNAEGKYVATSSNIKYSPQNSCVRNATTSPNFATAKSNVTPVVWDPTPVTTDLLSIVDNVTDATKEVSKASLAAPATFDGF